ncbi:hypothetical protein H4R20_003761 [Coemansia guatemalensis]|uniref:t-SNARE coiled-coil homology domain-containing protein n=1 Tax=Coemansia guatemalensis TaxID=2761395 RepID=A0A9W8LTR9_9FUNG|nr:hypothetical protein H4R20_003761 [Coemansia guatemalensis]
MYIRARCAGEHYSVSVNQSITNIMDNLQAAERAANNPSLTKSDREVRGERYLEIVNMFVCQINTYRKMEREQFTRSNDRLFRLATALCPEIAEKDIQQALDNGNLHDLLDSRGKGKCDSDKMQELFDDLLDRQYYAADIERTIDELSALYNEIVEMANCQHARLDALVVHLEWVDTKVYGDPSSCDEIKRECQTTTNKRRMSIWLNLAVLIILIVVVALGITLGVLKSQGKL